MSYSYGVQNDEDEDKKRNALEWWHRNPTASMADVSRDFQISIGILRKRKEVAEEVTAEGKEAVGLNRFLRRISEQGDDSPPPKKKRAYVRSRPFGQTREIVVASSPRQTRQRKQSKGLVETVISDDDDIYGASPEPKRPCRVVDSQQTTNLAELTESRASKKFRLDNPAPAREEDAHGEVEEQTRDKRIMKLIREVMNEHDYVTDEDRGYCAAGRNNGSNVAKQKRDKDESKQKTLRKEAATQTPIASATLFRTLTHSITPAATQSTPSQAPPSAAPVPYGYDIPSGVFHLALQDAIILEAGSTRSSLTPTGEFALSELLQNDQKTASLYLHAGRQSHQYRRLFVLRLLKKKYPEKITHMYAGRVPVDPLL